MSLYIAIAPSSFLVLVFHKILFAQLDYSNASSPPKCQMAPSNSKDPISQSLEPKWDPVFLLSLVFVCLCRWLMSPSVAENIF